MHPNAAGRGRRTEGVNELSPPAFRSIINNMNKYSVCRQDCNVSVCVRVRVCVSE